ncbi:MAG: D-glycero-beta-D-manno-heptose 1-phosphate adenylyltransferase [Marmoricola sp.]
MSGRTLVVLGDALLDVDLVGSVERVTPDAPALVVADAQERPRPGGAALAAVLAARRTEEVVLLAPLAEDEAAGRLRALLAETAPNLRLVALPWEGATPVKQRVRAGGQTLLRLDTGDRTGPIREVPEEAREVLATAGAVLVSDYGRGATADETLRGLLEQAARRAPVVWDPHPRGAPPVPGVTLATPNQAEARSMGPALDGEADPLDAAARCAGRLVRRWGSRAVAVTLGEQGALLSFGDDGPPLLVPAPRVSGGDTCGAGDSFASAAAVALLDGALPSEAVAAGVAAAGAFVAAGGAAGFADTGTDTDTDDPTDAGRSAGPGAAGAADAFEATSDPLAVVERVRAEGGRVVATGGCFDLLHAGHVATLRAARRLGDCLVVCLNSDASVRRLKGSGRPVVPEDDRAHVLAALECVDAVAIFEEDSPEEVLRSLRPDVWVKGGDYTGTRLPEADVLSAWGGRAVVLPYLDGRSTTSMVRAAADGLTESG